MRALVACPGIPCGIELRDVPDLMPGNDQVIVKVHAVSINRGEMAALAQAADGWRPGWDCAGVVHRAARDGSGPAVGTRIVGLSRGATWAEYAAIPVRYLTALPATVTFEQAALLPVAGLTAIRALGCAGLAAGKRILVTGAAGAVGQFALQLGHRSGAHMTALIRDGSLARDLTRLGADGITTAAAVNGEPFDLIIDLVGGSTLTRVIAMLAPFGTVVLVGNQAQEETAFVSSDLYRIPGAALRGFLLFNELDRTRSAARDLHYLASLIAQNALSAQVDQVISWREAGPAFTSLLQRTSFVRTVLSIE